MRSDFNLLCISQAIAFLVATGAANIEAVLRKDLAGKPLVDLVVKMLSPKPEDRPTAEQVISLSCFEIYVSWQI
jgi:hypothetical protein